MADKMEFPKTMREFIDNHSFKDSEEIYTNGAELVPVFRVEQALEHYEKEIRNKALNDFAGGLQYLLVKYAIENTLEPNINNVKFSLNHIEKIISRVFEQLKAGGENE